MPQSRNALNLRGFKLLLLALLTAAAALAALTFSTTAQTPGGESNSDSTETAQGRIIARIHDTTGEDGVDNYRVEFGFFPEWAMDEADPWTEAIAARSSWLPSSRFLTKSAIDARAAADNRAWLRSSLISVPAQSAQSPGGDSAQITGRVIARYNPDSEGRLRVEFGFVPEWAFTDTSTTEQAVERLGASNLPSARYLRVDAIDASRGVWLRSSAIDVPFRAPVVVIETVQPPAIDSISCTPSSPTVDESVTCTATLSGGDPDSYAWSGGASTGSEAEYTTSFSSSGSKTISLTVTNTAGSDTGSTTLSVEEPVQPPAIDNISCTPSSPTVDESVTCTADLSGDAPDSYAWSGGASAGSGSTYTTSFSTSGSKTISLTAANTAGSDTGSATLTVEQPLQPPVIDSISCTPSSPATADEDVNCTANLSGGDPDSWAWSGGVSGGSKAAYSPSFDGDGDYTVSLTVANADGADTASTTVTVGDGTMTALLPPEIDGLSCSPSSPTVDEDVTCTATLSGDEPVSYEWRAGSSNGDGQSHSTSFSKAGDYTVLLTVTNSVGSDTDSITLTVFDEVQPPVIDGINCSPSSPMIDEDVICTPSLSGGAPDSYAWSGGGDGEIHSTSFSKVGDYTVSLTVTNSAGSDTTLITLAVQELQAPVIDDIYCQRPPEPGYENSPQVFCIASLSGGAPDSYAWSGVMDGSGVSYLTDNRATYVGFVDPMGDLTISLTVANAAGSDSASVTVEVDRGATFNDNKPLIDSITCTPSDPPVNNLVECTAGLSGGAPSSYAWSGGASAGSGETYLTRFSEAGDHTISLTVTNSAGSDTASTTLAVQERQPPVIDSIDCLPVYRGGPTLCTANLSGGAPTAYAWSGGTSDGSEETYRPSFATAVGYVVSLTVTNPAGSDSESTSVPGIPICSDSSWSMNSGTTRTFEGDCTDPDGDALTYTLSSSDTSVVSVSENNGVWTVHAVADGTARVDVTATDPGGLSDQTSQRVTVFDPYPPDVESISCTPLQPAVHERVTCTAALSGTEPDSYIWRDGTSTSSTPTYSTSYSSPGTYVIELYVSDRGTGTGVETTVTVR